MVNVYIYDVKHKMIKRCRVKDSDYTFTNDGWIVIKEGKTTLYFNKDDISSIEIEPSEYADS